MSRNAFSLVELSIVLVIIGLLAGGVMVGSSLIRGAEVKSVMAEYAEYKQAGITFRNKYAALPGDLTDASNYWAGATNGNGDGRLGSSGAGAGLTAEFAQFWSQLALAGLIEGQYTGLAGSGGTGGHMVPGSNIPAATLTNAGWGAWSLGIYAGDAGSFDYDYGNLLTLGGDSTNAWNYINVLKPEEAWNIDTKLDDGMPGAGRIIVYSRVLCANSTSVTDYAAQYRLDSNIIRCTLYFTNAFNE